MNKTGKGYFNGICSGALFGVIPMIILILNRSSNIPSTYIIMLRMLFAGIAMIPFALPHWKKNKISMTNLCKTAVCGFIFGVTVILLYESYRFIPSGVGIVLHYTYPLTVLVTNALVFHQRINKTVLLSMLASLAGVTLLCDMGALSTQAGKGIALALGSSFAFCSYLIWIEQQQLSQEIHPSILTMLISLTESFTIACYNLIRGYFNCRIELPQILMILLIAVIALLAILTQTFAIKAVGSALTAILGTTEPIVCTIGSALVLHDRITWRMLAGTALILASTVVVSLLGKKETAAK